MWFQWKDVELIHISGEMEFTLYGREVDALVEGVSHLKYMGRILDRSDNYCLAICQTKPRAWKFWDQLGKILRQ